MSLRTKPGWIARPHPRPDARLRLFCAPHAGGGPRRYHSWPHYLPEWVEVCSLLPPGRGNRILESPLGRMEDLLEEAIPALEPELDRPFAFFGHSMGGMISFALAREVQNRGLGSPAALFVSGCNAPQFPEEDPMHVLPHDAFVRRIRDLNSVPAEVWANEELMELMLPVLRADCKLSESYLYEGACDLKCPIFAFDGEDDPLTFDDQVQGWSVQTSGAFTLHKLAGDHFFLDSNRQQLLELLSHHLDAVYSGARSSIS